MVRAELQLYLQLRSSGSTWVRVVGDSMLPTLQDGDKVLVTRRTLYRVGDIVVFSYGDRILVHRVVAVKAGRYLCKGDGSGGIEALDREGVMWGGVDCVERGNVRYRVSNNLGVVAIVRLIMLDLSASANRPVRSRRSFRLWYRRVLLDMLRRASIRRVD